MAKDPAFLFYSSDFLTGVSDLTMEERGQYITLLCIQHQKGIITPKSISLTVGSVSLCVMDKFIKDKEGNYYNEKLVLEVEKRQNFTESRRQNGKLGGRGNKAGYTKQEVKKLTKSKTKAIGKATTNLMEDRNINENINKDSTKSMPSESEFLDYCKSILGADYPNYTFALKAKYDTWKEADWKNGFGVQIKPSTWKNTIRNTIPKLGKMIVKDTVNVLTPQKTFSTEFPT